MRTAAVGLPLVVIVLAGCASSGTGSAPGSGVGTPDSTTQTVGVSTAAVELHGRLEDGARPGCTFLRTDDGRSYVLAGLPTATPLTQGAEVTVDGALQIGVLSFCNGGDTVQVDSITAG